MTKKRRRPIHLHVMVSEEEQALIQQRMAESGIRNMGAYMRKMALNGYVLHVDLSPVRELVSLQRRCSNNLNQVAIQANTYGGIYPEEIAALQRDYDAEKDQWYFNGEEVRYFRDVLTSNGESLTSGKFRGEMRTLGSGVGTIDIYTVRDYGHLNSEHHGTLTGIEKYSQEEFDEHTQAGMSGNQPIGNASHN